MRGQSGQERGHVSPSAHPKSGLPLVQNRRASGVKLLNVFIFLLFIWLHFVLAAACRIFSCTLWDLDP